MQQGEKATGGKENQKRRKPGSAQKAANVKEQGKGREKRKKYLPLGRASIASGYTPAALAGRCPAPWPLKGEFSREKCGI